MREAAATRPWRRRFAQRRMTRTWSAGAGPVAVFGGPVGAAVASAGGGAVLWTPGVVASRQEAHAQKRPAAATAAHVRYRPAVMWRTPRGRSCFECWPI